FAAPAALALVFMAGSSFAQQPPAAAPPQQVPPLAGTAIPGLCVFSQDDAIAASKLGQYIAQRLQTIGKQAQAELQSTQESLQNDAKAVDAQRASLSQEALEQKALEIRQRNEALQRLAQQRDRELQLTQAKALQRFATETNPLFDLASKERNCSIVLNGEAIYNLNPQMDITPLVVTKLDAKITEFAFDRERLEQQLAAQGAQAPAAAPPAAASRPVANPPPRPAATQPRKR
ncbi:MAG TPA: OmpH family outer membrane protein, partial [Caulobacteraceae bacterium]|nr:OmpH family outer membrane protein [Caulobacteraceae bacterium]